MLWYCIGAVLGCLFEISVALFAVFGVYSALMALFNRTCRTPEETSLAEPDGEESADNGENGQKNE